jgi:hypothetical protein
MDNVDGDEVARETAHYLTVPPEVVKSASQIKLVRQERQKKMEAQEKMALAAQGSEVAKNLGGLPEGGEGGEEGVVPGAGG